MGGSNARDDLESTVNVLSNPGRPGEQMKHASYEVNALVLSPENSRTI